MYKKIVTVIILSALTISCTSCSTMESNVNKLFFKINESQSIAKETQGLVEKPFYDRNNINEEMVYDMPDSNYLVLHHDYGISEECREFEEILNKYMDNKRSFIVYTTDSNFTDGVLKLEFVHRKGNKINVEETWYSTEDIEKLPLKVRK